MIVLFRGSRGTGKTLSMVKRGLEFLKEGWAVYTNLSKTRFIHIDSDFILNLNYRSKIQNVVLCIDEIELFFDAREWNQQKSKQFSKFLQQLRKRNIIILCTAQFTNLIDIRLRQQIDFLCICKYDKENKKEYNTFIDLTSSESSKIPLIVTSYWYAEPIFKEYDTLELIN